MKFEANYKRLSFLLLFTLFLIAFSFQNAFGISINYDASLTPDDASLSDIFSTRKIGGSWSASGGILTMTNVDDGALWFGNHPFDPVPWQIADNDSGNYLYVNAMLQSRSSGAWGFNLADDSHRATIRFLNTNEVVLWFDGANQTVAINSSMYHEYSMQAFNGQVIYSIDGVEYSGLAPTSTVGYKTFTIGEISGLAGTGAGTLLVDEVSFQTDITSVPEPATVLLLASGLISLTGFRFIKTSAK